MAHTIPCPFVVLSDRKNSVALSMRKSWHPEHTHIFLIFVALSMTKRCCTEYDNPQLSHAPLRSLPHVAAHLLFHVRDAAALQSLPHVAVHLYCICTAVTDSLTRHCIYTAFTASRGSTLTLARATASTLRSLPHVAVQLLFHVRDAAALQSLPHVAVHLHCIYTAFTASRGSTPLPRKSKCHVYTYAREKKIWKKRIVPNLFFLAILSK